MAEQYERKAERKFCYFVVSYVEVTLIKRRWMLVDGVWEEEDVGVECPKARECRRQERNCLAIYPKTGADPFIPFRNPLADMW